MDKLVLFDVDNTLIKGLEGHKVAFSEAFKKVYGIDTNIDIISHQGMTDQQIIVEVLKKNGVDEQTIKSKLEKCIKAMISSFNKVVDSEKIIVLDGVRKLLEELSRHNVLIGLVTGNLEPIARGKLKKVDLNDYFKVGGFGSDDIDRTNLVKIAIRRAEEGFCFKFTNNNVFLFGDTPREIRTGKEAGVKTVGVATGHYSTEELKNSGADFVLEDLRNTDEIIRIIGL